MNVVRICDDHYADRTSVDGNRVWWDFSPDYIAVNPSDILTIYSESNKVDCDLCEAHISVMIYYTTEPN